MLRTLLVGIDGSPEGCGVMELAIRWAKQYDALLVGIGIIDEPGIHGPEEALVGAVYFEKLNQSLLKDSRRSVDLVLERCGVQCAEAGVAFKPLEDVGTPYVQILREAQRYDLILLGRQTHFRFGWDAVSDDTLPRVLAASPRPVVAVPEKLPEGDTVLVAYDGSLQAARALAVFEASGLGQGRTINVVSACDEQQEAARVADVAVEFLRSHELKATAHPVSSYKSPSEAVLNMARELEAGLIVMGAYGQPVLREFFLGSVTRRVLSECEIPMFLYH